MRESFSEERATRDGPVGRSKDIPAKRAQEKELSRSRCRQG